MGAKKSMGAAMSAGTSKSAGTAGHAGTAQVVVTATTLTRSVLAAIPGSIGTRKKGSKSACTSRKKRVVGAQIVELFPRAQDEGIPCGQRENMDWLLQLADSLSGQSTSLPSVL